MQQRMTRLEEGTPIFYGGDKVVEVPATLAAAFREGDRLVVVQDTGALLHIPADDWEKAQTAVDAAVEGFQALAGVSDTQIASFLENFASGLADDERFEPIAAANQADVEAAASAGRTTTRLVLTEGMRRDMIEGLRAWAAMPPARHRVVETVEHTGWVVRLQKAPLGVVGFVFEGRPNVLADAAGVLKTGNTVAFRIGSAALRTAGAIMEHAVEPALSSAGLPSGAMSLVGARSRAAGWALFSDERLGLAVARGSGAAVSQLGSVARQTGTPVSLHGTGGAWIITGVAASAAWFGAAVTASLDRKVCNTLNTACVLASHAEEMIPVFLEALDEAGERRGTMSKLHVTSDARHLIPEAWFDTVAVSRAGGEVGEPRTEVLSHDDLGTEWEWEDSPEVTLTVVDDVDAAARLFNRHSPRFVASLISDDEEEQQRFFDAIDAPFVGNGFTRWVDGQYALGKPELGLSNWQWGRLFSRGGILSGDSIYTIRARAEQIDPDLRR